MGPVEFEALVRRLGLDPDDHDLDALHAAYLILEAWRRLRAAGAAAALGRSTMIAPAKRASRAAQPSGATRSRYRRRARISVKIGVVKLIAVTVTIGRVQSAK